MNIYHESGAVSGERLFLESIATDASLRLPLTSRLCECLLVRGLIDEREADLYRVCFDEAIKNAMVHGNGNDPSKTVKVELATTPGAWQLLVRDEGLGFSSSDVPDTDGTEHPVVEHGRGIQLMRHFVDAIEFFEGGRCAVLTKTLGRATADTTVGPRSRRDSTRTRAADVV